MAAAQGAREAGPDLHLHQPQQYIYDTISTHTAQVKSMYIIYGLVYIFAVSSVVYIVYIYIYYMWCSIVYIYTISGEVYILYILYLVQYMEYIYYIWCSI